MNPGMDTRIKTITVPVHTVPCCADKPHTHTRRVLLAPRHTKSELAYPCGNRCEHRTLLPVSFVSLWKPMRTPVVSALHDSSVTSPGPILKFVLRPPPVPHWYKRWPTRENRIGALRAHLQHSHGRIPKSLDRQTFPGKNYYQGVVLPGWYKSGRD